MAEFELRLLDAVSEPANRMKESLSGVGEKVSGLVEKFGGEGESKISRFGLALDKLFGSAHQGRNDLGQFTEMTGPMAEGLAAIGPIALAAGVAVAAVGAALVGLTYEMAKFALEATAASVKLRDHFAFLEGGSQKAGAAMVGMLEELAPKLGMTVDQLAPLATRLQQAGFEGEALAAQLKVLATLQAAGVDASGQDAYLRTLIKLREGTKITSRDLLAMQKAGLPVDVVMRKLGVSSFPALEKAMKSGKISAKQFQAAMTEAITTSGAKALEDQANSLDAQWALFKENITKMFGDVDIAPFLDALKDLLSIFDSNTNSGKAMHAAVKGMLDAIFKAAAKLLPYIKKGFELAIIAVLKVYIALKPLFHELGKLWKKMTEGQQGVDMLDTIKGAFDLVVAAVVPAIGAMMWFIRQIERVMDGLEFLKGALSGAGGQFDDGFTSGIKGGVPNVIAAVKGMGASALKAITGVLGTHSPSREMARIGKFAGLGFVEGLQASNDNVGRAAGAMGSSALGGASRAGGGASAGGGSVTINVAPGAVVIHASGEGATAQSIADSFEEQFALMLERVALTQGLGQAA